MQISSLNSHGLFSRKDTQPPPFMESFVTERCLLRSDVSRAAHELHAPHGPTVQLTAQGRVPGDGQSFPPFSFATVTLRISR